MNRERFLYLIEAYGSRESAWPVEERAAMLEYLDTDEEARSAFFEARELDLLLDSYQPPLPDLGERILAQLPPPGALERLLAWLFPGGRGSLLRPVLASALPLVLGLALGLSLPALQSDTTGADSWETQERYLLTADLAEENWYD